MKILVGLVLVIVLMPVAFGRQDSGRTMQAESLTFRRGQPVYIAAFRQVIHREDKTTSHTVGIAQELDVEKRVRKEFEDSRFFKVVDKLSEAEFVFLVYVDSSTGEALTLAPEKYRQHKEKFDLDTLREAAYGRYLVGPFLIPTLGKISDRLSESFHKDAMKGDKATSK